MKTMMQVRGYAWKVALLFVGAVLVACSEGMMRETMHSAAAGTGGSTSASAGGAGASGTTTTGSGGGTCSCAAQVTTVMCTGTGSLSAVASYPGLTAQEIAGRVVAVIPVSGAPVGSFEAGKLVATEGVATYYCNNGEDSVTFVFH